MFCYCRHLLRCCLRYCRSRLSQMFRNSQCNVEFVATLM
uniref:Uncharacterized protein n=1 Tax=Anguilla anguilla TaxID=7936 RepID=A0A0E9TAC5_ANGAN